MTPDILPDIDFTAHREGSIWSGWTGLRVDVGRFYEVLTARGWKIDREESNCMRALCRAWPDAGVKVHLSLELYVCAPPYGEVEAVEALRCYRFDPAEMPSASMYEQTYNPGDEREDWYPGHYEEWEWLVLHGDPHDDARDLLRPLAFDEAPAEVLAQLREELMAAARAS